MLASVKRTSTTTTTPSRYTDAADCSWINICLWHEFVSWQKDITQINIHTHKSYITPTMIAWGSYLTLIPTPLAASSAVCFGLKLDSVRIYLPPRFPAASWTCSCRPVSSLELPPTLKPSPLDPPVACSHRLVWYINAADTGAGRGGAPYRASCWLSEDRVSQFLA